MTELPASSSFPHRARAARWAVTTVFAANGVMISSLAVRTPSQKLDLDLTDGQLGLLIAALGLAAVLTMQYAGGLATRLGSAPIVRLSILALPLVLLAIAVAPTIAVLAVAMVAFGTGQGLLDVTLNGHAVAVERVLRRPILNGCHAAWSIGAAVGSVLGAGAVHIGLSRPWHYLIVVAVVMPAGLVAGFRLLPAATDRAGAPTHDTPAGGPARDRPRVGWRAGWTRRIVLLGAMGATVLACEGAVISWSGVYLHDELGATLTVAALGYVAFAACQTSGRLVGDRLLARYRPAVLLRVGAIAAAAGMLLVVLGDWPVLAVAGFAILGLGLATGLPVLFGVVGHWGAEQGDGATVLLARFSTMTYAGILLAPALIGTVAQWVGLTWTLAGLIPLLIGTAVAAPATTRPPAGPGAAPDPGRDNADPGRDNADPGRDSPDPGRDSPDSGRDSAGTLDPAVATGGSAG